MRTLILNQILIKNLYWIIEIILRLNTILISQTVSKNEYDHDPYIGQVIKLQINNKKSMQIIF